MRFFSLFFITLTVGVRVYAGDLRCGIKGRLPVTLRVGIGLSPESLDPQKVFGEVGFEVSQNIYATLVQPTPHDGFVPNLARSWEHSKDGFTWTFHLRRFVTTPSGKKEPLTWSDGTPFTSKDVLRGLRRLLDPRTASAYVFLLDDVKNAKAISSAQVSQLKTLMPTLGVDTPDDHTVVFHLLYPAPYLPQILAMVETSPLPAHMPFKNQQKGSQGNATTEVDLLRPFPTLAPYTLARWSVNDSIVLCRNPHYWKFRKGLPKGLPERVVFRPLGLGDVGLHVFERTYRNWKNHDAEANTLNGIDVTATVPSMFLRKMLENKRTGKGGESFSTTYHPSMLMLDNHQEDLVFYDFNNKKLPFKGNPKLRRALSMVIPRDKLVTYILGGGQKVSYDFFPPMGKFHPKRVGWASKSFQERVKEARKLLKEAGYSKDHPARFKIIYNTSVDHKAVALTLLSSFQKAFGEAVRPRLVNREWKAFLRDRLKGEERAMTRSAWGPVYFDPDSYARLYETGNPQNTSHYSNKDYDRLVRKARRTHNTAQRLRLYSEAECLLKKDSPGVFLHNATFSRMEQPYVKGDRGMFRKEAQGASWKYVQIEFLRIDKIHPRQEGFSWKKSSQKSTILAAPGVCPST